MDLIASLRSLGALALVLGLLAAGAWGVRRYAPGGLRLALPGGAGAAGERRLHLVERLALDQRRALLLVRHDAREHLILLSGDQAVRLDAGGAAEGRGVSAALVEEAVHA
ncbi:flagellar biosynthetic protein FliO [Sphingomonas sp. RHCKR7]|uniref:flagellar biosynthetic protein FliO n=1 Tax=Sphingomonas folli TaxID=2862497 RepID=UPI001CA4F6B6|nr:flagellar biosynthetic protein FliO [Sphingomonas folli]MBW6525554.1 flagellar biosynthetic protein FliO [Sphingomonas folli]